MKFNLNGNYIWIKGRLQAVGYSSSKLKFKENGIEDSIQKENNQML